MPPSGSSWVQQFPTSTATTDLTGTFRTNADSFISALRAAGATVSIAATFRPLQRAHLMHYAYRIANEGFSPAAAPVYPGIDIQWVHTDSLDVYDENASRAGALAMVRGYKIVHRPALTTRHTEGLAVDMTISWSGTLKIAVPSDKTSTIKEISSLPRSGANTDLHAAGRAYGVIKLISDAPHWSSDGH